MSELKAAIDTLVAEYAKLDDGISAYTGGVAEILKGYAQIIDGSEQLASGSENLSAGTHSLYDGANQLVSGINSAYSASGQFVDGTQTLENGVDSLNPGIGQLDSGVQTLVDGTSTLKNETEGIDGELDEKIDDMIHSITRDNFKIQSFVSNKNTNIKSVQFILKTQEINTSLKDNANTKTKPELNFWQKLLKTIRSLSRIRKSFTDTVYGAFSYPNRSSSLFFLVFSFFSLICSLVSTLSALKRLFISMIMKLAVLLLIPNSLMTIMTRVFFSLIPHLVILCQTTRLMRSTKGMNSSKYSLNSSSISIRSSIVTTGLPPFFSLLSLIRKILLKLFLFYILALLLVHLLAFFKKLEEIFLHFLIKNLFLFVKLHFT